MIKLIALERNAIAQNVAGHFSLPLAIAQFKTFADGEVHVTLDDASQYAGAHVVIIQSTSKPVNDHMLGIAFLAQELKNAGAARITAVIPYFGYSRQEASPIAGAPGHAAIVAKLYAAAGIDKIITVELHEPSMINLFTIPVINLSASALIAAHISAQQFPKNQTCVIAPDKGIADYVMALADTLGMGAIRFKKERYAADQTRITQIEDECHGSIGIIVDDILATGGTALHVCDQLSKMGYSKIYGYFVHPVLAGDAIEKIAASRFDTIVVSNSLPLPAAAHTARIEQFDISPLIINALDSIMKEKL